MVIIVLVGGRGVGKDTIADYLKKNNDFASFAFANPIKECLVKLLPTVSRDVIWGISAPARQERARPVEWLDKEPTVIDMLNQLGNFCRNTWDNDIFIKITIAEILARKNKHAIITDCRFVRELDSLKTLRQQGHDVRIWQIVRETEEKDKINDPIYYHDEGLYKSGKLIESDIIIENNKTKDELYRLVEEIHLT